MKTPKYDVPAWVIVILAFLALSVIVGVVENVRGGVDEGLTTQTAAAPTEKPCDRNRIDKARNTLFDAIANRADEVTIAFDATEGINAESDCTFEKSANDIRAQRIAWLGRFAVYGWAYGGHRRDLLETGKSFVEPELEHGEMTDATRRALEDVEENIREKMAMSQ